MRLKNLLIVLAILLLILIWTCSVLRAESCWKRRVMEKHDRHAEAYVCSSCEVVVHKGFKGMTLWAYKADSANAMFVNWHGIEIKNGRKTEEIFWREIKNQDGTDVSLQVLKTGPQIFWDQCGDKVKTLPPNIQKLIKIQ